MTVEVKMVLISGCFTILGFVVKWLLDRHRLRARADKDRAEAQMFVAQAHSKIIADLSLYVEELRSQVRTLTDEVTRLRRQLQLLQDWISTLPLEIRKDTPDVRGE